MNEDVTFSDSEDQTEENENQQQVEQNELTEVTQPLTWDTAELVSDPDLDQTARLEDLPSDATGPLETISFIRKKAEGVQEREPILRVAKRCHVGAIRERNEDSCLVFVSDTGGHFPILPFGFYVVADGMGGHQNGHVASKTASRVVARNIINRIYIPLLQEDNNPIQTPIQEVMTDAVQAAHMAIYDPDPEHDGGTTLTAALILGRRLYIAHVGDTRIYMKTDEKFETLTIDHSLVQRLQDVGQLTAEEATFYQYRHILLRALGQGEEVEIDTYMRLLPPKGKLLLCTDGLSGIVSEATMKEVMGKDIPLQQMADELFEAAMAGGGYDNITVVLVDFNL